MDKLSFAWQSDIRKERNKKWLLMFKQLEKFKGEKGHCNVPSKYEPDKKLGRWVEVVRGGKDKLEAWKIRKLKKIGFQWSENILSEKEERWYQMYRKLEAFYQKYGHSNVPEYWAVDKKLSVWVMYQRRPKKSLPKNKITLLEKLNFSWNHQVANKGERKRNAMGRFISDLKSKSE